MGTMEKDSPGPQVQNVFNSEYVISSRLKRAEVGGKELPSERRGRSAARLHMLIDFGGVNTDWKITRAKWRSWINKE